MGKELTILAVAASVIFGVWFFSKEGCKGDGANGLTGPEGSLCWSGDSLQDMLGGIGGGDKDIPVLQTEDGPQEVSRLRYAPGSTPGSLTPADRGGTPESRSRSTGGGVGGPSKAALAHAYFVNNRISIA